MEKDITNADLLAAIGKNAEGIQKNEKLIKGVSGQVAKNAEAIEQTKMELGHKIDSLERRIDGEVIRRTDEHAAFDRRIRGLEGVEEKPVQT